MGKCDNHHHLCPARYTLRRHVLATGTQATNNVARQRHWAAVELHLGGVDPPLAPRRRPIALPPLRRQWRRLSRPGNGATALFLCHGLQLCHNLRGSGPLLGVLCPCTLNEVCVAPWGPLREARTWCHRRSVTTVPSHKQLVTDIRDDGSCGFIFDGLPIHEPACFPKRHLTRQDLP